MNFTFADVSGSYLNVAQQGASQNGLLDSDNAGPRNQLFAHKLSKILGKTEHLEAGAPSGAELDPAPGEPVEMLAVLSEKLNQAKGIGFVVELKNILLVLSKGDLNNISIDADGLEALKKMLLQAGFSENDINDLMSELSEVSDGEGLPLDDVLNQLFDLPADTPLEKEAELESFLDISAVPFLESIFISLGIPGEQIQEIMSEADKGDKGISLDVVIEKLQAIQKTSFYNGNYYQTKEGDDNFKLLFKQLDLEPNVSKTSVLTLDDLVRSFEKMRKNISQEQVATVALQNKDNKPVTDEKFSDLFSTVFKGLKSGDRSLDNGRIFDFSSEQIKNEFKKGLLIPGKESVNKNGLQIPDKDIANKNGLQIPDKDIVNKNGLQIADKESVNKNGLLIPDKDIANKNELQIPDKGIVNKNGLQIPGKESVNKNELLMLDKDIVNKSGLKNTIIQEGLKEIESQLNGKKDGPLTVKNQAIEGNGFSRQLKSETAKITDQTGMSATDVKTNESPSNLNILKTKASLKNLPTYVTQQVSKSIVRAINQGENTLKIQLKPPELGRLIMTIDNSGNNMKVSVVTENIAAKEVLVSNMNELKTVLSNSGVNLEKFDVDMNSDFRQSMADAKSQSGQFGKNNRNKDKDLSDEVNNERMGDLENIVQTEGMGGSLHFVA